MEIRELETEAERRRAVLVLRQLWSHREPSEVLEWTGEEDYHLFGRFDDGDIVGAAGVLVRELLHHERHAWLYDLAVDEPRRGEGHGRALVRFVETWAAERGCERVALASPLGRRTPRPSTTPSISIGGATRSRKRCEPLPSPAERPFARCSVAELDALTGSCRVGPANQ